MQERIGPHFLRAEARTRAGRLVRALLAPVERKNGWQLAEAMGERSPHGPQRRLSEADWDKEAGVMRCERTCPSTWGREAGVLVVDETGFLKKGKKSAGVANQYRGAAYGKANSQIGVFLLYASAHGATFLDRALYLPEEWLGDPVRCREAGVPYDLRLTGARRTGQAHAGAGVCSWSASRVGGGRHLVWV